MSNTLFDALFAPHVANDNPFLITPGGHTLSCRDFIGRTGRLANALVARASPPAPPALFLRRRRQTVFERLLKRLGDVYKKLCGSMSTCTRTLPRRLGALSSIARTNA